MTPKQELDGFIDKFSPEVAALARKVLTKMRKRLPGAIELVYDNYNALAIGFSPTERRSDIIFSIALYPRWVSLFFFDGVNLPDPQKQLRGSGNKVRHIVLEDAAALDKPAVRMLMSHAIKRAARPLDSKQPNRIVIKMILPKQRPRRPQAT